MKINASISVLILACAEFLNCTTRQTSPVPLIQYEIARVEMIASSTKDEWRDYNKYSAFNILGNNQNKIWSEGGKG